MSSIGRQTICLCGDSFTEYADEMGWATNLRYLYRRKADLVNRGFSGYTSSQIVQITDKIYPDDIQYLFSTVCLGGNDAVDESIRLPTDPDVGIPIEEYISNMRIILERARTHSDVVIALSPPPVDSSRWPTRNDKMIQMYTAALTVLVDSLNESCTDLDPISATKPVPLSKDYKRVEKSRIILLNLFEVVQSSPLSYLAYLSDGIHLSKAGDSLVFGKIIELLGTYAPQCLPQNLPLDFPAWQHLNRSDVASDFTPERLLEFRSIPRQQYGE